MTLIQYIIIANLIVWPVYLIAQCYITKIVDRELDKLRYK